MVTRLTLPVAPSTVPLDTESIDQPLMPQIFQAIAGFLDLCRPHHRSQLPSHPRYFGSPVHYPPVSCNAAKTWLTLRVELLSALVVLAIAMLGKTAKVASTSQFGPTFNIGFVDSQGKFTILYQVQVRPIHIPMIRYSPSGRSEIASMVPRTPFLLWKKGCVSAMWSEERRCNVQVGHASPKYRECQ
jgi:hypothetical protein